MAITDIAGNAFESLTSPMIGYVEPVVTSTRELNLRIYNFLIESIREEDQLRGNRFVERYLEGPQAAWLKTDRAIRALPLMWSVTDCDDRVLPLLKWIVGWTSELDYITDELDSVTLRRLIAASVPFWRVRGTEDALVEILRLTTGARLRIFNWFDVRWISGDTGIGEEHQGHDSWLFDIDDNAETDVRIVDDGTLNRRLVRNLVKLTRTSGERFVIHYLGLLDQFVTDTDDSQWAVSEGAERATVAGGKMTLGTDSSVYVNLDGASSWQNYVVTFRVKSAAAMVQFYRTGDGDNYYVTLEAASNVVRLGKHLAGTATVLATVSLTPFNIFVSADLFYALRVEVTPEANSNRIQVYVDANLVVSALDASHAQGSIAVVGSYATSTELDEVELFFNPMTEDVVDANS
jgi:phage tail-like protein